MSPTCSNRFLAGRNARSATVRTMSPSPRMSAQLWTPARDLDSPPAHQHPDQAQSRRRVIVLAAGLSDVLVGKALPFVCRRVRRDRLDLRTVLLLAVRPFAKRSPNLLDPLGQLVPKSSRSPTSSTRGPPGARTSHSSPSPGRADAKRVASSRSSLRSDHAACRAWPLVDLDLEGRGARQAPPARRPRAFESRAVVVELVGPVRAHPERVQLEREPPCLDLERDWPASCASTIAASSAISHSLTSPAISSRTGPGRLSNSIEAATTKQPPRNTSRSMYESQASVSDNISWIPPIDARAPSTSSMNISRAARTVST